MYLTIVTCVIAVMGVIGSTFYFEEQSENEKAKAGLQQCVEQGALGSRIIVWKKECKCLDI